MIRNNQHTLSDFEHASRRFPTPGNLQKRSKPGKINPPKHPRRRIARRAKLPRFTTSEGRVAWMENELVKRWPDYIKAYPKKWLEGVEIKYGRDPQVKLLLDLIINGAKPIKKIGGNGRKSRDTGMLPWNPHLVLVLDKLVKKMGDPAAPAVLRKKKRPDRISV